MSLSEILRRQARELAQLNRRVAAMSLHGDVVEVDATAKKVRVKLGEDPETGEAVLTPWIRVAASNAGRIKTASLPSVGEIVEVASESGIVGPASVARPGVFTDASRRPEHEADEYVASSGGSALRVKDDEAKLQRSDCAIRVRSNGRIVSEVKERKKFKIKIDDKYYAIQMSALELVEEE